MGRYRPPRKPSSKYITPEGKATMEEELRYLWKEMSCPGLPIKKNKTN